MPGSGKSVVALALKNALASKGVESQILSSDELRAVVTPDPRYTKEERGIVYGTLAYVAGLFSQNRVNVIIDATGHLREYRDTCRRRIRRFAEIYLDCPLKVCVRREKTRRRLFGAPSRIYDKAKRGESKTVPGMGVPYEKPLSPEVTLDSTRLSPTECAEAILAQLSDFLSEST